MGEEERLIRDAFYQQGWRDAMVWHKEKNEKIESLTRERDELREENAAVRKYLEDETAVSDELRRILDEAPHMPGCYQSCPPWMCDCWKSRVEGK